MLLGSETMFSFGSSVKENWIDGKDKAKANKMNFILFVL